MALIGDGRRGAARSRGERGQSMTEFALVMPLLVGLLVAIMLLAIVGFSYISIGSAARMGARHVVGNPGASDAEVESIMVSSTPFINWDRAGITITPPPADRIDNNNYIITVQISYEMNLPTIEVPYVVREGSFFLLPPIILHAESLMLPD